MDSSFLCGNDFCQYTQKIFQSRPDQNLGQLASPTTSGSGNTLKLDCIMMTSCHGHTLFITGPLCRESKDYCGFLAQRGTNAVLWWFLCCYSGSTFEQILKWLMKWEALTLMWHHPYLDTRSLMIFYSMISLNCYLLSNSQKKKMES